MAVVVNELQSSVLHLLSVRLAESVLHHDVPQVAAHFNRLLATSIHAHFASGNVIQDCKLTETSALMKGGCEVHHVPRLVRIVILPLRANSGMICMVGQTANNLCLHIAVEACTAKQLPTL